MDVQTSLIPIAQLRPSPLQPRKHTDPRKLTEMIESVRKRGVMQPILVRPLGHDWQVVDGHTRFEAAKRNRLEQIPALVRDIPDDEVLELQLEANLQRGDLHPMDEAEAFGELEKKHGRTHEQIAERVSKTVAYVRDRLQLLKLGKGARAAFVEGRLNLATAMLISRIPHGDLQDKAVKEIVELATKEDGEPMTARLAALHLRSRYMLRLVDAPFARDDADLVRAAGSCEKCPKRTGNQRDLFADLVADKKGGGADLCTDPKCWDGKCAAVWERRKADAEAKGLKVLSPGQAKKVFQKEWPDRAVQGSGYVTAEETTWSDGRNEPWKKLLGKNAPVPVLALDPMGRARELYPREEAEAALKRAKKENKKAEKAREPTKEELGAKASKKKEREEAALRDRAAYLAMGELVDRIEREPPSTRFWAEIYDAGDEMGYCPPEVHDTVARRRGLTRPDGSGDGDAVLDLLRHGELPESQARALCWELLYARLYVGAHFSEWDQLRDLLKTRGLDRKVFEIRAKEQLNAEAVDVLAAKKTTKAAAKKAGR